jgi:hypothetical protein
MPLSIGSLLYLGSFGLIAAGIVAVFFGAGFSLLVPTAGETISGLADRPGAEAISLLPSLGNDGQASAPENKGTTQSSTAFSMPAEGTVVDGKNDVPSLDRVLASRVSASPVSASKTPIDTSAEPANAPVAAPSSPAAAPPSSGLSNAELTELLHQGDALLRNGDVASARLFYERAAGAGDGRAALRLGATFDPEFLGRLGLGKLQANPAEARAWYSRARDLGAVDAKRQLNSLRQDGGSSFQ